MSVKRRTNVSSILLSESENETLFNMMGRGCVTLASGVCQLYTADAPSRQRWSKRFCGVVCFIKDNPKRSYFIRLYDIKKDAVIWEQEIYNQFKYKTPREYFHTFEADDVQTGLNFASEDEAIKFKNAVEQKLLEKQLKKMEKKKQQGSGNAQSQQSQQPTTPSVISNQAQSPVPQIEIKAGSNTIGKNKGGGKKDKKKKLTKEDISTPTAFRHVSHVGWDPTKGFDMNNLDTDMKTLFEQVGINNATDIDKETVDFIYDFVEQHGGIQKIKEEMKQKPASATPHHNLPPQPPPPRNAVPPPPPTRGPATPQRVAAPPTPSRTTMPPPPTPSRQMGSPPAPPSFNAPPMPPPQAAKVASPAPAPPPPPTPAPAPGSGIPPPPPPPPPAPPCPPPFPDAAMPPPAAPSAGVGKGAQSKPAAPEMDAGNMFDIIRSGKKLLNKVEKRNSDEPGQEGGIVGALAMALANRQKIMQISDDENDDSSVDDDDEWDD